MYTQITKHLITHRSTNNETIYTHTQIKRGMIRLVKKEENKKCNILPENM